ncbi:M20/M25/M40 family metallo-hydrolase [Altererythrobacter sp. MTPC7]|uniref:M20/M25/M40 family metallo-hydrolase n=1 Tax=Altererythrobacter sp. MTPC7 TaxID=3056567 RepID=UPI0036F2BCC7
MRHLPVIAAIIGAFILAIIATTPPRDAGLSAPGTAFSAARAMQDVEIIAREPHVTGSQANAEVREHIAGRLQAIGMEVSTTQGLVPEQGLDKFGNWSGTRPDALTFTNVIGVLPGRDRSKPALLLMAHHDTVWNSPGAPDDTAGVAAIIETLRASQAQGPLERDVIALFTDAEELGLVGARQFFGENPLRERVGAIVNLEARGGGGRTTLFQTSRNNGGAVEAYAGAVDTPGGSSLATFVYETLPNDTDLTPALELDVTAYNLSFIGRPGLYHSPLATPANLDRGALQDMGEQTLALTRALGEAQALPEAAPNATFFDVFGLFVLHYGTVTGWILLGLTILLHIFAIRTNEAMIAPRNRVWRSVGASMGVIVGGGAVLYLLNLVSGAGAEGSYYDRLAAIPYLEAQALLVCAGALAVTAPLWAGRKGTLFGLVLAIAAQVIAPITTFIIVFPLLVVGVAGFVSHFLPERIGLGVKVVGGAIAGGFLLQYGHQLMQGVGPDMPSVTALLAALAIPALGMLVPRSDGKASPRIAAICLLAALAIALFVRFDPVADTVADYASMKG